ncbi:hypothetical protein [Gordonia alkanivorans]|uniref:hypothetical protein n=1 Tax=Gordonia alkanivorans TaxID=84096 RepID=UPI0004B589E5|nr:hypothetical protein [Gordonia alkanivorans]
MAIENAFEQASVAVAELTRQLELTPPPPVVKAATSSTGVCVAVDRLGVSRQDLRTNIATYDGRLRAPMFTAGALAAIAAAHGAITVDLSAHATTEQVVLAGHFRTLSAEWHIRRLGLAEATSPVAAAHRLWRPDRFSGDEVVAVALLELLPRADAAILPPEAVRTVRAAAIDRVGEAGFLEFLRLWRAALSGRPLRVRTPSLLDWVALAERWCSLSALYLPDVHLAVDHGCDQYGVSGGQQLLAAKPSGDPSGRAAHAELLTAAAAAASRAQKLAALRAHTEVQSPPAHRQDPAGVGGLDGGAGGAVVSGSRTVTWRPPEPIDHHNRRLFTRELAAAGHRRPRMAPTPVAYPSGRVNTRQLAIQHAQIVAGRPATAMPWTAMRTQPRLSAELHLAVVIDTSATMLTWTGVTVPLGWAAAHAVSELGGNCTVWGFAGEPFPIISGGRAPSLVPEVRDHGSGSYGAVEAMAEATATLLTGEGCPILVVVTDGMLPDADQVCSAVADYSAAGIQVIWVMPRDAGASVRPAAATVIDNQTPASAAAAISAAVFAAIMEPGRR